MINRLRKSFKYLKENGVKEFIYQGIEHFIMFLPFRFYYKLPEFFIKRIYPGTVVKNINGFDMILDVKNDHGISRDLFFYRKREFESTDYLLESKIIKEGDTVLDIGGNIGYYALLESRLVGKSGLVYALEPVRSNLKLLKKNLSLNNVNNIKCYKLAAGNENKVSKINVSRKGNISSFSREHNIKRREICNMVKIDTFLEDKKCPNFVRMDVEGFEWAIIEGMKNTLTRDKLTDLLIELHPQFMSNNNIKKMFKILKKSGFKNVIIIIDFDSAMLDSKRELRTSVKIINKLRNKEIDDRFLTKKYEKMNMDELLNYLLKMNMAHAHFFKEK